MKRLRWGLIAVGALLALLWFNGFFGPDQKIVITKRLKHLTELASFTEHDPSFRRFSRIKEMGDMFSDDVVVVIDTLEVENHTLHGRDEVMQTMMAAKSFGTGLKAEFVDMNIELGSAKQEALVDLTLKGKFGGDSEIIAQELQFTMKRVKGQWLITRVETVHTLKP